MASPPGGVPYVCGEVVSLALLSAVVTEAVAYMLIYRTSEYQRLSASVDKVSRIIEKKREAAPAEKQKAASKQKKIDRIEKSLGTAEKGLAFVKMKLQLLTMTMHILTFTTMYHHYNGVVVAKLPFSISMISSVTHRSLEGTDWSECSVVFLYMLSSMAFKPALQRLLGVAPSATQADPFGMQKALMGEHTK